MKRIQRAAGAVVGSAVGDALGAPFEFGPPGALSARFPAPGAGGEMCGGGGWDPGEA
ncbi:ADP-ribosylglycohydrolase family protein, partial [Streptomyces tibetensis]|uniref:ADP-ribosylglycohydrolase family protein n=1 Tax=Streptomyces tibetensis TaxID=2382123 RepID=UPI0033D65E99